MKATEQKQVDGCCCDCPSCNCGCDGGPCCGNCCCNWGPLRCGVPARSIWLVTPRRLESNRGTSMRGVFARSTVVMW